MDLNLNIHIKSWIARNAQQHSKNKKIDPSLLQMKGNSEQMIVDTEDKILIKFDYPIENEVVLDFKGKSPWTLTDLIDSIAEGYIKIYDDEDDTRTLPATTMGGGLVNRPKTDGRYGIWGHDLGDLFIDRVWKENNIWNLEISS